MQEVLIGRDGTNNTLKITTNGKSVNGEVVPRSVSREHCIITIKDDGTAVITNINPKNVTFVNGLPVQSKDISGNDTVELGGERYKLDLKPFKLTNTVNIAHLEKVWNRYKEKQEKQRISMIRKNALRSITGLFSMGAIVVTFIKPESQTSQNTIEVLRFVLYGLAIITIIWTVISSVINAPKIVREENEMKQDFQDHYICPNCGMFFGFENRFDMLVKSGQCNRCRSLFKV